MENCKHEKLKYNNQFDFQFCVECGKRWCSEDDYLPETTIKHDKDCECDDCDFYAPTCRTM